MAEDIRSFLLAFHNVREQPRGSGQYICRCPAHDDQRASLSIKDETGSSGRILLYCHAGCSTNQILAAVGKTIDAIQPANAKKENPEPWEKNLVAEYQYHDADGRYLYSKLRYLGQGADSKLIRYARISNGKYQQGKGDCNPVLYRLPELLKAIKAGRRVYLVEGEKDAETLRKFGMTATTAGGTSDWKRHFSDYFIGASEVIIIADRDEPGQKLAKQISKDLRSVVYDHRIITPSGLNHGDVTDYLNEEGGDIEQLLVMIEEAEPIFATWVMVSKGRQSINVDLLAAEILKRNEIFIARNPGTKSDLVYWYRFGVYQQRSEAEIAGEVRAWLPIGKATPDTISKVSRMIMYSAKIRNYDEINADEKYINLGNGLLNITSGELLPHNAEIVSTLQLNCDFVLKAQAPKWETFIKELCWDPESDKPDQQLIMVLQEWTGLVLSCIYGYRLKKALIMFSAEGNSGKTVFLTVIGGILGRDAISNVCFKDLGSSRWATGRAFGQRCLAIGDEGGSEVESSAIFKQLTGGDLVGAEMKGLQGFDFVYKGVIVALCNVLPYFSDDKGNHVAERLMILPCRRTVPVEDRDPHLVDKLLTESDGIFQWGWIGLQRFIANGYKFSHCQSVDDLMDEYRARRDTMYAFLRDEIDVTGDRSDFMKKTDLEYHYSLYCSDNDLAPLSKKNIPARLASLGIREAIRQGYSVFLGIKEKSFISTSLERYPAFDD